MDIKRKFEINCGNLKIRREINWTISVELLWNLLKSKMARLKRKFPV